MYNIGIKEQSSTTMANVKKIYQEIAYISTAAHFELFKPIDMCKISYPVTPGVKIEELKFEEKKFKFILRITES